MRKLLVGKRLQFPSTYIHIALHELAKVLTMKRFPWLDILIVGYIITRRLHKEVKAPSIITNKSDHSESFKTSPSSTFHSGVEK